MIRASSLFYAMVLSLLLAAVLGSIILGAHMRNYRTERWLALNGARDNVYSALFLPDEMIGGPAVGTDSTDLFGGADDPVRIEREAWGLFDLRICTARKSDQRYKRSALLAKEMASDMPALYVADQYEAIALAGNTKLDGPCFLPARGLRRAYIEGRPYSGPLSFPGTRPSEAHIPELPEAIRERIAATFDQVPSHQASVVTWRSIAQDSVRVAYEDPPLFIDMAGERLLAQRHVEGHVFIFSDDSVTVLPSFTCSGIVLRAPYVTIASGSEASLQCFTRQGILVEEDVDLTYPSVLVCEADTGDDRPSIVLSQHVTFEGVIIGSSSVRSNRSDRVTVELQRDVTFTGELWNSGAVQVSGTFRGCAVAGSLVVRTPSSVYRGHLLDADIGPLTGPRTLGVGIWATDRRPGVLRWNQTALR